MEPYIATVNPVDEYREPANLYGLSTELNDKLWDQRIKDRKIIFWITLIGAILLFSLWFITFCLYILFDPESINALFEATKLSIIFLTTPLVASFVLIILLIHYVFGTAVNPNVKGSSSITPEELIKIAQLLKGES